MKLFQECVFETDDLEAFGKMLETFISLIFTSNKKPKLLLENTYHFDDGRYDPSFNHEQPDVVQVGNKYHFLEDGRCRGMATLWSLGEEFKSEESALEAGRALKKECPPKRKWITTLFEYEPSWTPFGESGKKKHITANSKQHAVQHTLDMLKAADLEQFEEDFEEAADQNYDNYHVGYRLEMGYHSGQEVVHVSLVHIYFGK